MSAVADVGCAETGSSRAAPRAEPPRARPAPRPGTLDVAADERALPAEELLGRARLTEVLIENRKPLVLLAAPPGFGKTTLLRQWQQVDERPFARVALEPADEDPALFWTRIVEALRAVRPELEGTAQIALHGAQPDVLGAVAPLLAHELRLLEGEIVLALDDYQAVGSPVCHESLAVFLGLLPPNVTLVLSTRADPPVLPVATLRTRGELLELRAADLAFTSEEEAAFLNETLALALAPELLPTLHERTEGWPAGVYLAALSLRQAEDAGEFVSRFGGSNRHVVDYLTEVVLAGLDPGRRQFLLDTSIVDSVCPALADALTGRHGSAVLLEELDHGNLFLVPLDDRREWYRYHALFRELLRTQLLRHDHERVPALHRRAFAWYRDAGRTDDALAHALATPDLEAACDLVAERWLPQLDATDARRTERRLDALPAEAVAGDARLRLARSWTDGLANRPEKGAREAHAVAHVPSATLADGTTVEAAAAVVEGFLSRGDAGAMLAAARRSLETAPALGAAWRPLVLLLAGWAEYLTGGPEACASLGEAAASAAEAEQWLHESIANALLARVAHAAGDEERERLHARAAVSTLEEHGLADPLASGLAEVALGGLLTRSDTAEAEAALDRGLTQLRTYGDPLLVAEAILALAPLRRRRAGPQAGRRCVAEARELVESASDAGVLVERLEHVARTLTPAYRRAGAQTELTERELEVLRYLAEGLPKRDIGALLFLSYNTIHSHTKSIYQKLRVSSREAAVAKARELGAL